MVASFPWYDLSCVQWANDVLWFATGFPGTLERNRSPSAQWSDPVLVVSQACGLDLFLSDAPIEPVATPVFDLDCQPGKYYSYIVGNPNGRIAAVNSLSSHSGCTALLSNSAPEKLIVTGSHLGSLEALRTGVVEVAAIDAVTWAILERDMPSEIAGVSIVGRSADAPAPPYVIRQGVDGTPVFAGLQCAFGSEETIESRNALLLKGIIPADRDDYSAVLAEHLSVKDLLSDLTGDSD